MNRALRAATMGALLLSPVVLTACSAGQVTQTVTQNRDKVGAEAKVGDITLRQIQLAYPENGKYASGDDAELLMAVVNGGNEADTLVGIEGDAFKGVVVSGQATPSPAVPGTPSATPSETPGAVPATPTVSGTLPTTPEALPTTPAASTPAAASSAPTSSSAPASSGVDIPVPARSTVFLGGADGLTVTLSDLSEELTAGQSVTLTLTFQRAGEVTVSAVVAAPGQALPRGDAFNFHTEEGTHEESGNEVAGGGNPNSGG